MQLVTQEVVFTFANDKYKDGLKKQTYANVKLDVTSAQLQEVGSALARLRGDQLNGVGLLQHQMIPITPALAE